MRRSGRRFALALISVWAAASLVFIVTGPASDGQFIEALASFENQGVGDSIFDIVGRIEVEPTTHSVRPDDTLESIAREYDLTPAQLLSLNPERDPDRPLIPSARLIVIPGRPLSAIAVESTTSSSPKTPIKASPSSATATPILTSSTSADSSTHRPPPRSHSSTASPSPNSPISSASRPTTSSKPTRSVLPPTRRRTDRRQPPAARRPDRLPDRQDHRSRHPPPTGYRSLLDRALRRFPLGRRPLRTTATPS